MDLNKRKEITKRAAEIAIENPNISMRELARQVGDTTSTTLKKFFDEILPEYYPEIKKELDDVRQKYKEDKEHQKYLNSATYRKERRRLIKIEDTEEIAEYIIQNHATLKDASIKFNKPIARVQRGINAIRATDVEMDKKLEKVFSENKENYYKKLGEMTKAKIATYNKSMVKDNDK